MQEQHDYTGKLALLGQKLSSKRCPTYTKFDLMLMNVLNGEVINAFLSREIEQFNTDTKPVAL